MYESLILTVYWYSFIKSEFIYTPFFLVTAPVPLHWNASFVGSLWDVPPYDALETFASSNSNLYNVKSLNVIVSPSLSVADIVATTAPFELFSLIDESVWLVYWWYLWGWIK